MIKNIKKLKSKSHRTEQKLYIAEGTSTVFEAMENCLSDIEYILFTEKYIKELERFNCTEKLVLVSEKVFESVSETKTPQGIMAVVKMNSKTKDLKECEFVIYLDGVSDPGNLGTIIRTADASGADMVIMSPECVDVYNSKTVRATMGSLFHIYVLNEKTYLSTIDELLDDGFTVFAGCLDAKVIHYDADFKGKTAIVLGNEAHGVSSELLKKKITKIKIPIPGKAESLNVSTAGAVLMYEAVRQREYDE